MNLKDTIDAVIDREGGDKYTDNPRDRGGPTRWGITEQVARAFGYAGAMALLPREIAEAIYKERYWTGPRFDQVALRDQALGEKLLDVGVNMGQAVAGRFLQRALNVLNQGASAYPDISADGNVGPMTLSALEGLLRRRGAEGAAILREMVEAQQRVRYMEIAEANPLQEEFEFGWQRRAGGA